MAKPYVKARYRTCLKDGKHCLVHRVIYEQAHGKIPEGYDVHHIDGNSLNNELRNLQLLKHGEHKILEWAKYNFFHLSALDKRTYDSLKYHANKAQYDARHYAYLRERRMKKSG